MCSEDLCNGEDYDLHAERARRLFQRRNQQQGLHLQGSNSRNRTTSVTTSTTSTSTGGKGFRDLQDRTQEGRREEEEEDQVWTEDEIYYEDPPRELEHLNRIPRQLREGRTRKYRNATSTFQSPILAWEKDDTQLYVV